MLVLLMPPTSCGTLLLSNSFQGHFFLFSWSWEREIFKAKRDPEDKVVLLSVNSDTVYLKCSAVILKDTNQNQRLQFT